jgi:hypothetical protein
MKTVSQRVGLSEQDYKAEDTTTLDQQYHITYLGRRNMIFMKDRTSPRLDIPQPCTAPLAGVPYFLSNTNKWSVVFGRFCSFLGGF